MSLVPRTIRYILSVYMIGIVFFTLFRCLLLADHAHTLSLIPGKWTIIARSLLMGLRFDTVVSGFLLLVPGLLLFIAEISGRLSIRVFRWAHRVITLLYVLCMFICVADIPFFNNYNNRLNTTVLDWTASPMFMLKMVAQDDSMSGYFLLFIVVATAYLFVMSRLGKAWRGELVSRPAARGHYLPRVSMAIVFFALMALGIRGRIEAKSPIVIGTAYFSDYDLPNKAALNPVYTFMTGCMDSWKEENKRLRLMDDNVAADNVKRYLRRVPDNTSISAFIPGRTEEHKYNVVVVLMESMSGIYLRRLGNLDDMTPNLDTLAAKGYLFNNFFSAGIHTFNGIFSTLYGFPALMARHSMEGDMIPSYTGLPYALRDRGYSTTYFTTHDDQFDNVGGFLSANYFQYIISQKDYPAGQVMSTMGVADHNLFGYAIPYLTKQHDRHRPFLAVLMTGSNHPPYAIPTDIPFTPRHPEVRHGGVEYADWAIGDFMRRAAGTPWFDSTIFVFLGDHGTWEGASYGSLPYWYSHVPLIIYAPRLIGAPKEFHTPGGQTDVFPTIMGLLGGSYLNNTMGVDLTREGRPYAFFSQDDKIGVADSGDIYVWEQSGHEYMYHLGSDKSVLSANKAKGDSMRVYAFSMIQYARWLHDNNKAGAR